MLPGFSGGTNEFLVVGEVGFGEGAADLTEDVARGEHVCPGVGVLQQWWESVASMGMCHGPAERPPEPLDAVSVGIRSEEHTSELQSRQYLVCRLLLEKKKHISRSH